MGRERLRQILHRHRITFQRTKTCKESTDPQRDAKLARIEYASSHFPQRVFAFDEFGPLVIHPQAGTGWAPAGHPHRLPANYHKLHGVRQFHGCYSVGDDQLWGVVRRRKSAANTLAALKSIGATRPDGAPIYVILDNLSAHKGFPGHFPGSPWPATTRASTAPLSGGGCPAAGDRLHPHPQPAAPLAPTGTYAA
ncbi:hypothetical protein [Micromonospora carbonacea]|uniref:hypothetical protein n=1 Tax=Micromonospora carbonacea TaxID=47853 RepID=UPI003D9DC038